MINSNIRTPNIYTDVNINTQRSGLLKNTQRVLFITDDDAIGTGGDETNLQVIKTADGQNLVVPKPPNLKPMPPTNDLEDDVDNKVYSIYDSNTADEIYGEDSTAGRMMVAAIKTNRTVDVQCLGKPMENQEHDHERPDSESIINGTSTGFRIKLNFEGSKSDEFFKYNEQAKGSLGETVINLANLFDDKNLKLTKGWSGWSNYFNFDELNHPNSGNGVCIVFNKGESPNFGVNLAEAKTVTEFFKQLEWQMSSINLKFKLEGK